MTKVAIITARGGSKRIPRKNIKLFRDKPIIAYSIEAALQSNLFDLVMVSTDDEEIATVAKAHGAEVPFYRSAATSDDHATTAAVITEVLQQLATQGLRFTEACCIYPTAPFVSVEHLQTAHALLRKQQFATVFPVAKFSYPVQRGLTVNEAGNVSMLWPENLNKRSQDLPPVFHDAGQFYWINIAAFGKEQKLFTSHSGVIVLDELEVQDIDNETDWKLAELKHALLYP